MAAPDQFDQFGNPVDPAAIQQAAPDQQNPTMDPIYGIPDPRGSTGGDTGLNHPMQDEAPSDPTVPTTPDTTTPDTGTTTGTARQRTIGPAIDPATGLPGQPTGPAPDPTTTTPTTTDPYAGLQTLLAQMLAGQQASAAQVQAQRDSLTKTLNGVISSAEQPVSASDPEIVGPTDAFSAQGQRARALEQEQLAQQAAATGQTSGSVDSAVKSSFEDLGNATGSYQGGLMVNELQSRRNQLQAALTTGAGLYTADQQAQIQSQMDSIDAQIAQTGQQNQNSQFYDNLSAGLGTQASSLDTILAEMIAQGGGSVAA